MTDSIKNHLDPRWWPGWCAEETEKDIPQEIPLYHRAVGRARGTSMSACRIGKPIVIVGGITSGKPRAQVEQFHERYPEWSSLISFIAPSGTYRVIAASSNSLSVEFTSHPWRLTVHQQAPLWWVAEIHDMDECARHPEVYIAPMVHTEGADKLAVAGEALRLAREQKAGL